MDCGKVWYLCRTILTFHVCSCMRLVGRNDSHSDNDSLDMLGLHALPVFTAQGATGRCLRDVWFHHNPAACINTSVTCSNISLQWGWVVIPADVDQLSFLDPRVWQWCGVGAYMHAACRHY